MTQKSIVLVIFDWLMQRLGCNNLLSFTNKQHLRICDLTSVCHPNVALILGFFYVHTIETGRDVTLWGVVSKVCPVTVFSGLFLFLLTVVRDVTYNCCL